MARKNKALWQAVRKLCLENYELLKDEYMRDAYYLIRDLIMPFVNSGEVSDEEYAHLLSDKGYSTFRDDMWTSLEKKYGIDRPQAKPVGIVIEGGLSYTITRLRAIWDRARGFIFCEKEGTAVHLTKLSLYGWVIIAGQGYPTRLMRKLLKEDERPVLALHDADPDGEGIFRALGYKTRRTSHLNLDLGDRVIDLGLSDPQAKALNLPTQYTPEKYQKQGIYERVELSALSVLKLRQNIENPILAYTVAVMDHLNIKISPLPDTKQNLATDEIEDELITAIMPIIKESVGSVLKELKGEAVEVSFPIVREVSTISEPRAKHDFKETFKDIATELVKILIFKSEDEIHKQGLKYSDERIIEALRDL